MPQTTYKDYLDFDEIVFEHRNKEYGAYALRKAYFRHLVTGSGFAMTFFLLAVFVYYFIITSQAPGVPVAEYNPLLIQNNSKNIEIILPESPAVTTRPNENRISKELIKPEDNNTRNSSGEVSIDSSNSVNDSLSLSNKGGGLEGDTNTTGGSGMYSYTETRPEFPGGQQGVAEYIIENIRYPYQAIQYKLYGTVEIVFYISKEGLVENVNVAKSVNPILDNEAIRVIKNMPRWKPGTRNGKPVKVIYHLPISFPKNVKS
jgi:periplasmic protein TonB